MNVLLTGATGFLGGHLLPELIKKGYKIIILKRSFSNIWRIEDYLLQVKSYDIDKIDIRSVFQANKIDLIIHLATDYGKKNNNNVMEMLEPNIRLPSKLLDLGVKYKIKAFINTDTSTNNLYSLYSATKKGFLEIAKFFAANYEIKFINMALEYMYGERDDNTKGEQKRDFIYVKDVVHVYLKVLNKLASFNETFLEFNIGVGQSISLKALINKIEKIAGKKANIKWGAIPYRKNEIFDSKADIGRAKKLLNWEPKTSLEDGLCNTVNWYKEKILNE
ncbi:MAG: NAD-dependent epimerase/dehydratase family protein [Caldisericia bacterium]|nr:NAD-dependent epimerase/dehydratase family protein [Caldisericia bacterium]